VKTTDEKFLTTLEAARVLGCSTDRVRQLERAGGLPCLRTETGQRIFRAADVAALARDRAKSKA